MKFLCGAVLLLAMAGVVRAEDSVPANKPATEKAAPDKPLVEKALPAIKASIGLPEGWFTKEEAEDGIFVYQFTREKIEGENGTFSVGLTLTVTTKVQERAEMSASKYAEELVEGVADGGNVAAKSTDGPYKVYRIGYLIESEAGNIDFVNYAKANDKTGTLYFITWQAPVAEKAKLEPLLEKILASLKLDPAF